MYFRTFVHVYFRTLYLRSTFVLSYESTKVQLPWYFVRKYESTKVLSKVLSYVRLLQVHVRTTYTYVVRVHVLYTTRAGLVQGYHSDRRIGPTTNIRKEEGGCVHEASKQELMNYTAPSSGLFSFSATRRRDARACACICIDGMVGGSPPPLKGGRGRVGRWVGRSARRTERPEASVPSSPRAPNPQRRRRASSSSS